MTPISSSGLRVAILFLRLCRTGLFSLLLLLTCRGPAFCAAPDSESRPNIVLIMADDMGYECVGANGCLDYKTPNLDRLAASGIRFQHCYSQPICTPSRVKLMTGQSNKRNYIRFGRLDRKQTTFAQLIKAAGYRTCIAGKWQLGNETDAPQHFGFEQSLLWQHTRGRVDPKKHDTRYANPHLERNGQPIDFNNGEFAPDLFVEFIEDFINVHREEPFLVYFPMALVHCPFSATPDSEEWDPRFLGSTDYKGQARYFSDMVAYVDRSVARIETALQKSGVRENTLLIFTGDNGTDTPIVTRTINGRVVGAKGKMTDGGTHVTCIASWPQVIRKPEVVNHLIDFSDILPTLCEAARATVPERLPMDGLSFLPLLRGTKWTPRETIYMWYSRNGKVREAREFARTQQYKLYDSGEFYDVPADPLEERPLPESQLTAEQRIIHQRLRNKLGEFEDIVPPQAR